MFCDAAPGVVTGLTVTTLKPYEVTLTWSPPVEANGVIIGYKLQYTAFKVVSGFK